MIALGIQWKQQHTKADNKKPLYHNIASNSQNRENKTNKSSFTTLTSFLDSTNSQKLLILTLLRNFHEKHCTITI